MLESTGSHGRGVALPLCHTSTSIVQNLTMLVPVPVVWVAVPGCRSAVGHLECCRPTDPCWGQTWVLSVSHKSWVCTDWSGSWAGRDDCNHSNSSSAYILCYSHLYLGTNYICIVINSKLFICMLHSNYHHCHEIITTTTIIITSITNIQKSKTNLALFYSSVDFTDASHWCVHWCIKLSTDERNQTTPWWINHTTWHLF